MGFLETSLEEIKFFKPLNNPLSGIDLNEVKVWLKFPIKSVIKLFAKKKLPKASLSIFSKLVMITFQAVIRLHIPPVDYTGCFKKAFTYHLHNYKGCQIHLVNTCFKSVNCKLLIFWWVLHGYKTITLPCLKNFGGLKTWGVRNLEI